MKRLLARTGLAVFVAALCFTPVWAAESGSAWTVAKSAAANPAMRGAPPTESRNRMRDASTNNRITWSMKLINETVSDPELDELRSIGFLVLSGEWGMSDAPVSDVKRLLDRIHARNMQFIVNLSDGSAWGYAEDGTASAGQRPLWQRERVRQYIGSLIKHPAIFGYDISNEAGENLPNGAHSRITLDQLRRAAADVRSLDPNRPILLRMHYWDDEDGDFDWKNPFASGIADIVMLNLYSNYTMNRSHPLIPLMVAQSGQGLVDKIRAVDSKVRVWVALAAFQEFPSFLKPQAQDLERDIVAALNMTGIENIGFFGWGPERYPNEPPGWYLPRDGRDLLRVMQEFINPPHSP